MQTAFYEDKLGLDIVSRTDTKTIISVGWTELTLLKSEKVAPYHYCFLLPSNKLQEAIEWASERLELIHIEKDKVVQHFDTWNADSVYFFDGDGNLAEFIVRHKLDNKSEASFNSSQILCVNEIGLPTSEIKKIGQQISDHLGSTFWKGNTERFGTHGDEEGLILLPNPKIKYTWLPTEISLRPVPFVSSLVHDSKSIDMSFDGFQVSIS